MARRESLLFSSRYSYFHSFFNVSKLIRLLTMCFGNTVLIYSYLWKSSLNVVNNC